MHLQNIFSHTSRRIFASKNVYLHLNQNTLYYGNDTQTPKHQPVETEQRRVHLLCRSNCEPHPCGYRRSTPRADSNIGSLQGQSRKNGGNCGTKLNFGRNRRDSRSGFGGRCHHRLHQRHHPKREVIPPFRQESGRNGSLQCHEAVHRHPAIAPTPAGSEGKRTFVGLGKGRSCQSPRNARFDRRSGKTGHPQRTLSVPAHKPCRQSDCQCRRSLQAHPHGNGCTIRRDDYHSLGIQHRLPIGCADKLHRIPQQVD